MPKKILVISPEISETSAKNLALSLGAAYKNPYKTKKYRFYDYDFVFNYGCSCKTGGTAKKINKALAVETSIDKIKSLTILKDKIKVVPFTLDRVEAVKYFKDKGTVVARLSNIAHNGEGVVYCPSKKQLDKLEDVVFYTKFVEHTNEFRINIWKGVVLSVYGKVEQNNGTYKFKLFKGVEEHPQLIHIAKQIYENIKLDWCGIDVLRDYEGELHFLEVNSAPILYPYTLNKLITKFKEEYLAEN